MPLCDLREEGDAGDDVMPREVCFLAEGKMQASETKVVHKGGLLKSQKTVTARSRMVKRTAA